MVEGTSSRRRPHIQEVDADDLSEKTPLCRAPKTCRSVHAARYILWHCAEMLQRGAQHLAFSYSALSLLFLPLLCHKGENGSLRIGAYSCIHLQARPKLKSDEEVSCAFAQGLRTSHLRLSSSPSRLSSARSEVKAHVQENRRTENGCSHRPGLSKV